MTRIFDYTKPEEIQPDEVVSFLLQQARQNMVIESIDEQCKRAAKTGEIWMSEDDMDMMDRTQNIHRGQL